MYCCCGRTKDALASEDATHAQTLRESITHPSKHSADQYGSCIGQAARVEKVAQANRPNLGPTPGTPPSGLAHKAVTMGFVLGAGMTTAAMDVTPPRHGDADSTASSAAPTPESSFDASFDADAVE